MFSLVLIVPNEDIGELLGLGLKLKKLLSVKWKLCESLMCVFSANKNLLNKNPFHPTADIQAVFLDQQQLNESKKALA